MSKGPCTHLIYTLAPKYLNKNYMKANVYTTGILVHGPHEGMSGLITLSRHVRPAYPRMPELMGCGVEKRLDASARRGRPSFTTV